MPASLTYTSLLTDVQGLMERADDTLLTAYLPRAVMYAETRIAADLKIEGQIKVIADTLAAGAAGSVLTKPAYWRDTVSLQLTNPVTGRKFNLYPRPYEYCRNFWPNPTLTAAPRFYAEYEAGHYLLAPTPDLAYPYELCYHCRLDPLDSSNTVNWITMEAPQLMLQATMVEAHLFLKNADKAGVWDARYKESIASLKTEDSGRTTDATTVPK